MLNYGMTIAKTCLCNKEQHTLVEIMLIDTQNVYNLGSQCNLL